MTQSLQRVIALPLFVAIGIVVALVVRFGFDSVFVSDMLIIATILIGSGKFLFETLRALFRAEFGLDYIALAAIITAFLTEEYIVGSVIVLMLTTGDALEEYATLRAKQSLTALIDRIPKSVTVVAEGREAETRNIEDVRVGQQILIRRGEVIPLDGVLVTGQGLTDESSLTGEPYFIDKHPGDMVRSGTVNVGDVMTIEVTAEDKESTYRKIITLVQEAQNSQAPLIRLADRYSTIFTIITVVIAGSAYLFTRDVDIILAVLVVATPCPLLLATPIALIGGMSASAREKIIIKNLGSLEVLSRVNAIVFDKTGTITLGHPVVTQVEMQRTSMTADRALAIAASIEHNSLHPLAKAIVQEAKNRNIAQVEARDIQEVIGSGISGTIEGARYTVGKHEGGEHLSIALSDAAGLLAVFSLADEVKKDSLGDLRALEQKGFVMTMLTGDKQEVADKLASRIDVQMDVRGNCTPEDKMQYIAELRNTQHTVAMVGDGINDAPALAKANVGIVFSNEQHTAASEAADIVLLGGDFSHVLKVFSIAKRTIRIALQSIWVGIGLSVLSMILAAFGYIPPLFGALWQEVIDIIVIVNALRATRMS